MKVGFDFSVEQYNQAGTAVYAKSLLSALNRVLDSDSLCVFSDSFRRDMQARKTLRSRFHTVYHDIVWHNLTLPRISRKAGVDILHMPANIGCMVAPCPIVLTIHDVATFLFPQNFSRWHRIYYRLFMPLTATRAAALITVSNHSKKDIVNRLKINPEKVFVTYEAPADEFRTLSTSEVTAIKQKYGLHAYILTVGTLEPRKNIGRLIQSFHQLVRQGYQLTLVHVGPRGWLYNDIIEMVDQLGLRDSVQFLGRVPLSDLIGLYNGARVFVYPSIYEGFGLPVLEAMACGCPVITSNTSSLVEIGAEAALTIDPFSSEAMTEAIQMVVDNPARSQMMSTSGLQHAQQFSWMRCAQETASIYSHVHQQASQSAKS